MTIDAGLFGPTRLMFPERIQQRRTAGWRMPLNARSVTRPGRYGNPWSVMRPPRDPLYSLAGPWTAPGFVDKTQAAAVAVDLFERWMTGQIELPEKWWPKPDLAPLEGRDLACFCPVGEPCHADVLLRLANPHAVDNAATNAVGNAVTPAVTDHPYWVHGQRDGDMAAVEAGEDLQCGFIVQIVFRPGRGPMAVRYTPPKLNVQRALHDAKAGERVMVG